MEETGQLGVTGNTVIEVLMKKVGWFASLLVFFVLGLPFPVYGQLQLEQESRGLAPQLSLDGPDRTATTTPVVVGIEIEGNRRVEADTIRDRIGQAENAPLDRSQVSADIRRIYELRFFSDIQVEAREVGDGEILLRYIVQEMPAIDGIEFRGNSAQSDEDLREVVTLRRFEILNISNVVASAEAIRQLYHDEGYFLAEVEYEIIEGRGRDDLAIVVFEVREYSQVEVKRITFLGNEEIPDRELRNVMATREGNALAFLSQVGTFQEGEFETDLSRLMAYYYEFGFIQVQVEQPRVRLSRDKRFLYITIRIDEGPRHIVGSVGVSGDFLLDEEELVAMTRLGQEEFFRYSRLQEDRMRLQRLYQDAGFANAQVNPLTPSVDPVTNAVDVVYDIRQGQQVYIGRIEIVGNTRTRDQVLRREMQIEEGQLFSASAIEASQMRMQRLGYFEAVNITSQQTQSDEVIDLRVQVEERPTGTFQLGAGLSSQESFIFQAQVSQENLFGRGQSLQLSIQASGIRQLFNLRFSEPRFLGTQWQSAIDLYNFDFLYQDFGRLSRGGTLMFGYPIGDLFGLDIGDSLTASLRYKLEDVSVRPGGITGSQQPPSSPLFEDGFTSSLRLGVALDTRNNRMFPTRGQFHTASVELADSVLFSENEFLKLDGELRFYRPLIWNFVLRLNASAGYVTSTSAERPVPIFERYFVGGPETIRGFERFTLGPLQRVPASQDEPLGLLRDFHYGGNKKLILTTEIEFPIFAAAQVKGVLFADAGNAFDDGDPFSLRLDLFSDDEERYANALRTSVGFGVRWFSPIGPLRFEWGVPLQRLQGERPIVFDFSIQNAF